MSEWKENSAKRREFRNSHNGPEIPRPSRRKKDTKHWCRGVVGRNHDFWRTMDHWAARIDFSHWSRRHEPYKIYRCSVCSKVVWGDQLKNMANVTVHEELKDA
jgi:hypothetical protein